MTAAYSVSAAVVVAAVVFLVTSILNPGDTPSNTNTGSRGTQISTAPEGDEPANPPTDLLTPAGARQVVSALTNVMGGSKVSAINIYSDYATATAPATAEKNAFDKFEYRDGTATREGPDAVDPDRAVLDLNEVNWDALPALWQRAEKDLGIDKPNFRYVIIDTDLIDENPELKLYLSDDYGGAYLLANLAGEVVELHPRDG